jgi:signal transduction histidine kinase
VTLLVSLFHLVSAAAFGWLNGLATSPEVRAGARRAAAWRGHALVLLAANILVLLIGAAAAAGDRAPRVLESLEGLLGVLTVLVFAWGFGKYDPPRAVRIGTWTALAIAAVAALSAALLASPDSIATLGLLRAVWMAPAALAALALAVWLALRRPAEWIWGALGAAIIAGGMILGWAFPSLSPAALAIGQAIAVPLFSLGISLRLLAEARRTVAEQAALATRPSQDTTAFPLHVLASMSQLSNAANLGDFADHLVRAMAWATRSEIALLVTPPDESGQFIVANGFDLIQERELPGFALNVAECPSIGPALRQRQTLLLPPGTTSPDLRTLQRELHLVSSGTLLLVPISTEQDLHGAVILLSPYARRAWTEAECVTLESVAQQVARRLSEMKAPPQNGEAAPVAAASPHAWGDHLPSDGPSPELRLALQELADARVQLSAIVERSASERAPEQTAQDLRAAAAIARQLQQSITSVAAYTDLLLGDAGGLLGTMQRRFVERIRGGIQRTQVLIGDLARMTASGTGATTQTARRLDLLQAVDAVLARLTARIKSKNLHLNMDFPESCPPVQAEEALLWQILEHLLVNAIQTSPRGGEVWISAQMLEAESSHFVMLAVTDSGAGLPPENIGLVFDQGLPASRTGEDSDWLAVVKQISEQIGGRVWVNSRAGHGTTFTVLIPYSNGPSNEASQAARAL